MQRRWRLANAAPMKPERENKIFLVSPPLIVNLLSIPAGLAISG